MFWRSGTQLNKSLLKGPGLEELLWGGHPGWAENWRGGVTGRERSWRQHMQFQAILAGEQDTFKGAKGYLHRPVRGMIHRDLPWGSLRTHRAPENPVLATQEKGQKRSSLILLFPAPQWHKSSYEILTFWKRWLQKLPHCGCLLVKLRGPEGQTQRETTAHLL